VRRQTLLLLALSLAAAFAIATLLELRWWHPYCDDQADGPGFWATGFPFPHAQPTGISSLDVIVLVPVLLLNLAILAVPAFVLLRLAWRAGPRLVRLMLAAVIVGGAGVAALGFSLVAFPVFATNFSEAYDPLTAYRPAFAVDFTRHRPCDR
jgi:hypothetical protein